MEFERCSECGVESVRAFVHLGSFLFRCMNCGHDGPVTSWIAIGPKLGSRIRAVVVSESYEEQEFVALGSGSEILEAVGKTAGQGKLVLLTGIEFNA